MAVTKVISSDSNKLPKDNVSVEKQETIAKDETSVAEMPKEIEQTTAATNHGSIKSINEGQSSGLLNSRDKRVTRSLTGNLKPKQPFDKIQELEEVKIAKLKETLPKRERKTKKLNQDGQNTIQDVQNMDPNANDSQDENLVEPMRPSDDWELLDESSSDDGNGVDIHQNDSDYCPEDDPDRPWCICRKPHGNK